MNMLKGAYKSKIHPGFPRLGTSHHAVQYATPHSMLESSLFPSACMHVHHMDKLRKAIQAEGGAAALGSINLSSS